MPKRKAILVLYPNGKIDELSTPPSWPQMQALVGGYVEQVRVLDQMVYAKPLYSYMYVNEEGLLKGLPRNHAATQVYQRNVRLAFADSPNPFLAAKEYARQQAETLGTNVIESSLEPEGYEADPWIAGVAIYFEGWTCNEITTHYDGSDKEPA